MQNFFKKCRADHDALVDILKASKADITVSDTITGFVRKGAKCFSVYTYNVDGKEYLVTKKLHEFLISNGALTPVKDGDDGKA